MALSDNAKTLIEIGALVAGGLAVWYLAAGRASAAPQDQTVQTLPPDLAGMLGTAPSTNPITINYPASQTLNIPGIGPIDIMPPQPGSPFEFNPGSVSVIGGSNIVTNVGGGCGCCSGAPASGDAFATPQQAMVTIAGDNPYGMALAGVPAHAEVTASGLIIPNGTFPLGSQVPLEQVLAAAASPFPYTPPTDYGYGVNSGFTGGG